jgi:hypothetical protein
MATPIPDTLKQRTEKVLTADGAILVRRLYHKPARAFLGKLAVVIRDRASLLGRDGDGNLMLTDFAKIVEIIQEVDELADFLVQHSTDEAEAMEKADFVTWLQVLAAALRLNCGADLKNSFAAIGAALGPLLAAEPIAKTNSGAAPTPSSSTPATTPAT